MHIYTVVSVYGSVVPVAFSNYGFCCAKHSESFDSGRLAGCWRYSVQNSVDTNWKIFGVWSV